MTPASRRVLLSLVPVVCPAEYGHLAEAIVDHMGLTLGASPVLLQKGFDAGLLAYDLGAIARYGRRAHKLTGEKAEHYFEIWEHGLTPVQVQLAKAINQIMSLACYEQPEVAAEIGYDVAPYIEEVKQKRLTVYKTDIDKQAAQILAPDPLRPRATRKAG